MSETSGEPVIVASNEESAQTLQGIKNTASGILDMMYIAAGLLGLPILGTGAVVVKKKLNDVQIKKREDLIKETANAMQTQK